MKGGFPMKAKKLLSLLLTLALLLSLAACAKTTKDDASSGAVSVTDMADPGREIKLDAPATKVVALTAADAEIVCALGASDTLVGRGEYCDYPADISSVPSVASGTDTNVEEILKLEPQIVIMSMMDQTTEQVDALENAGVKVAITNAQTVSGVYQAIQLIGALVGKTDEADKLVKSMMTTFADLSDKATGTGEKTVYFEVSPLEYGLWTAGKNTFMDEICTLLGFKNAFADVDGWAQISEEQVLERDPDYIVTTMMYSGEGQSPVEEIMARTGWQDLKAIKTGNVFQADSDSLTRPGPRLADAAKQLFGFFYPEAQ